MLTPMVKTEKSSTSEPTTGTMEPTTWIMVPSLGSHIEPHEASEDGVKPPPVLATELDPALQTTLQAMGDRLSVKIEGLEMMTTFQA